ncbi:nicotinate-nucleotide--dimethylbenzimidazole phosphoribosyltransferase [Aneurinibacillus sp. Ricciae_BoGa-3]|uniref:nicotinate-nucleotide--dimethylbenzimidazole phosphoribosyltransferase n=1 Tax=Aneurinibacillus sp. Ricciae_BoGa-3 TaxID=3022697 RepID=UPI0023414CEB|nr:nicotinate-nucleotide--dimethylbenzimidazole phosphoribosyltransferase [Aneurinibacillus sp. Ricciae_BoGa-3]WCK53994.1 nicotinate-nucleotide--dimethylbenzimidazole phosphoribosyltransferase [Aneurinibacillus sp. Ricciae_BoGa-3]
MIDSKHSIREALERIAPPDASIMQIVQARVDNLTKPPGSLGELERMAVRLAGIQQNEHPVLDKRAVVVMCGDHGIVEEGVSAFPADVTGMMMGNFARGGAAINVFSRLMNADVRVVDIGSKLEELPEGIIPAKVKKGTGNMAKGPAMSREEALAAIETGIQIAEELADAGYKAIALGDMGIGNTTPSAAIIAAITGTSVPEITGKGTGIDEARRLAKAKTIERCLAVNGLEMGSAACKDGLQVLAKVGGLEIAGLVGLIIGGAANRQAVIVDGVIAGAAALVAYAMCPEVKGYLFASHLSQEPAHLAALSYIGIDPVLHLGMRLGEGSGAVLLYPLLDASLHMLNEMATFADIGL